MSTKVASKRKTVNNVKNQTDPKVRKKETIETMMKPVIVKKYKELEEEYRRVLNNNKLLEMENLSLKTQIDDRNRSNTEQVSQSKTHAITQTQDLLDEAEYPCSNCVYVADCPDELGWHMKGKHDLGDPYYEYNFSCKICRKPFDVKDDLMYHIKLNHERNMPLCKYFQDEKCNFSDDKCWYIHKKEDQAKQSFKCGYCGQDFKIKSEFMLHRKCEHNDAVKVCINHLNGKCQFGDKCWYNHEDENMNVSSYSDY